MSTASPPLQCSGFRGFGCATRSPSAPSDSSPTKPFPVQSVPVSDTESCDSDTEIYFDLPTTAQINAEFDAMDEYMQTTLNLLAPMPPTSTQCVTTAIELFAKIPTTLGHRRDTSLMSVYDGEIIFNDEFDAMDEHMQITPNQQQEFDSVPVSPALNTR